MNNLCKGFMTTSLSMALFVGGAVMCAAAQEAHEHDGVAQQSSPAATMPDKDNGMRQAPDKDDRAMQQSDRDRDAKAQDHDRDQGDRKFADGPDVDVGSLVPRMKFILFHVRAPPPGAAR